MERRNSHLRIKFETEGVGVKEGVKRKSVKERRDGLLWFGFMAFQPLLVI